MDGKFRIIEEDTAYEELMFLIRQAKAQAPEIKSKELAMYLGIYPPLFSDKWNKTKNIRFNFMEVMGLCKFFNIRIIAIMGDHEDIIKY